MRQIIPPILLIILFLTLQMTIFSSGIVYRIRPDLMMIITLYLSLSYQPIMGGLLAFIIGYLMDAFSGNSFGLFTFTRPIIFYIATFFKDRFYLESFYSQSFFTFIFTVMEALLILILLRVLNPEAVWMLYPLFFTLFLPQTLSTAIISPFLFSIFKRGSFLLSQLSSKGKGIKGISSDGIRY